MYFNANFNVFFKLIKVHLLVSELNVYKQSHERTEDQQTETDCPKTRLNEFSPLLLHTPFFFYTSTAIYPISFLHNFISNCLRHILLYLLHSKVLYTSNYTFQAICIFYTVCRPIL